jgi:hypothetical protein
MGIDPDFGGCVWWPNGVAGGPFRVECSAATNPGGINNPDLPQEDLVWTAFLYDGFFNSQTFQTLTLTPCPSLNRDDWYHEGILDGGTGSYFQIILVDCLDPP